MYEKTPGSVHFAPRGKLTVRIPSEESFGNAGFFLDVSATPYPKFRSLAWLGSGGEKGSGIAG